MSVYVDEAFDATPQGAQARRCGTRWCHMIADTPEELHAMASRIGMRREWFQPASFPHYDLVPRRRAAAVAFGAIEVDRRTLVLKMREIRARKEAA